MPMTPCPREWARRGARGYPVPGGRPFGNFAVPLVGDGGGHSATHGLFPERTEPVSDRVPAKLAVKIGGHTDPSFLKSVVDDYLVALNEFARVVAMVPAPPEKAPDPCVLFFNFSPGMVLYSRALVLSMLKEEGFEVSGNPSWDLVRLSWAAVPKSE